MAIQILKSFKYSDSPSSAKAYTEGEVLEDTAIDETLLKGLEDEGYIEIVSDVTTEEVEQGEGLEDPPEGETDDVVVGDEGKDEGVEEYSKEYFLAQHERQLVEILEQADEELTGDETKETLADMCVELFCD